MNATRNHAVCVMATVVFTLCVAVTAQAQVGTQKEALRGLTSVSVSVESLDKTVINDNQLRTQVELRLRRSGISVNDCKAGTVCLPHVYVRVTAIAMSDRVVYCFIRIEFNTLVAPVGEPTRRILATVWQDETELSL